MASPVSTIPSTPPVTTPDHNRQIKQPTGCSHFGRSIKYLIIDLLSSFTDIISKLGVQIILGIAAKFIYPDIVAPGLTFLGAATAITFVVKVLNRYEITWLNSIQRAASRLNEKFPQLIKITLLVIVILTLIPNIPLFIPLVAAGLLGAFNGLFLGIDYNKTSLLSQFNAADQKQSSNNSLAAI